MGRPANRSPVTKFNMESTSHNNQQFLILVDEQDRPCGKLEKMEVHRQGLLHRAFSTFIFNSKGELLLQQRAEDKYHSACLWSNSCCSHPRYGEDLKDAVRRRLFEELGIEVETEYLFSFIYRVNFDNGLTEHELDHVFFGVSDENPRADPAEVKDTRYVKLADLEEDLTNNPDNYSEWLKVCFKDVTRNEKIRQAIAKSAKGSPRHS